MLFVFLEFIVSKTHISLIQASFNNKIHPRLLIPWWQDYIWGGPSFPGWHQRWRVSCLIKRIHFTNESIFVMNALLTCTHNPCHWKETLGGHWWRRNCQEVGCNIGKPGGADGPHPVPVELGILGHLLSPSLDVLPVLPKCLCYPSLHLVKVRREPDEKIVWACK